MVVVTLRLPSDKPLVPERLYSYDVEITPQNQSAKQTLRSLGLLTNDPPNADPDGDHVKHLALGFEPDLLPCLLLPPNELKDLKIVHGSCRNINTSYPDALAYLDDLLTKTRRTNRQSRGLIKPSTPVIRFTDDVPRPLLDMLSKTAQQLIGATREHLPFRDDSHPPKVVTEEANLINFPVGVRKNIIVNEAGMSTTDGESHLMALGEFCAMYLYVWSNVCWEDRLSNPPERTSLPPDDSLSRVPSLILRKYLTTNAAGEDLTQNPDGLFPEPYEEEAYEADLANLAEFHRTLPKVRRALANVPNYMVFDDHEITDDWSLTQTWRDRVLGSPLGSAVIRNGMLAFALFQGWGNDPVKYEPRVGIAEKQPHEQLLELAAQFFPANAATAPDITTAGNAAGKIGDLLGLALRNERAGVCR